MNGKDINMIRLIWTFAFFAFLGSGCAAFDKFDQAMRANAGSSRRPTPVRVASARPAATVPAATVPSVTTPTAAPPSTTVAAAQPTSTAANALADERPFDMLCTLETDTLSLTVPVKNGQVQRLGSYQRIFSRNPPDAEYGEVGGGVSVIDGQWMDLKIVGDDAPPGTTVRVRITGTKLEVEGATKSGTCEGG